jgi:hypothetical protein
MPSIDVCPRCHGDGILSRMYKRRGVKLNEPEISRIYGERHTIVEAIEGSMPAVEAVESGRRRQVH